MFSSGPAQHALGRPQDRRSAAGSSASRGLLQGAACPPSLAELIFCLHSVACLSSIGPTLLFRMFSAFSDVDSKVCVCVCVFVEILLKIISRSSSGHCEKSVKKEGAGAFKSCCSSSKQIPRLLSHGEDI